MLGIPCCDGPDRLDPAFQVGDVFMADKVGNRLADSLGAGQFVKMNRGLIHLNQEKRGLVWCADGLLCYKQAPANNFSPPKT